MFMSPGEKLDPIPDNFILQPPVFYPVVPYVTTIFGGLHAGKMVMLQGMVPLDARRFQVDFQCGCSLRPQPDIAIHFNPRFHTTKPHVICNTRHGECWLTEARWPGLALQRGASFLILFLFENEEVKVSVNGQHFLHYRYRLPLSRVDTLGVSGDILVTVVGFLNINPFVEGSKEYPVGHPFLLESPRLAVPSSHALLRGLWPEQVIVVRGLVLQEPKEQNSGLDIPLGTEEADLSPLSLSPSTILRGEYAGAGSSSIFSVLSSRAVVKQERLKDVVGNCHYQINNYLDHRYRPRPVEEIISSAKEKVGEEMEYCVLTKNCEHFVTDLRYGTPCSRQVQVALIGGSATMALGFLTVVGCSVLNRRSQNQ